MRKVKSQQKSSAQMGTPRFVTFLKILGAWFSSPNPYRVREAIYKVEFDEETMKTINEALIT